jgi:hypothetical protein
VRGMGIFRIVPVGIGLGNCIALEQTLRRHLHPQSIRKAESTSQTRTGLKSCNALDAMGLKYSSDKLAHCSGVSEVSRCLQREAYQLYVEKPMPKQYRLPTPKGNPGRYCEELPPPVV